MVVDDAVAIGVDVGTTIAWKERGRTLGRVGAEVEVVEQAIPVAVLRARGERREQAEEDETDERAPHQPGAYVDPATTIDDVADTLSS